MFHDLTLIGRGVQLVPLRVDHEDALVEAANIDRSTYAHTFVPAEREAMRAYIDAALANPTQMPFATCTSDGRVIGSTRFMALEWWNGSLSPTVAEIGSTWLAHDVQRTAVNSEAKLLMLTHAFEEWKVVRMFLKTDALNVRSRTAIERLGAQFEGVLRHHMPAYGRDGLRDTAMYSIIPAEWPEVRNRLEERLAGA